MNTSEDGKIEPLGATTEAVTTQQVTTSGNDTPVERTEETVTETPDERVTETVTEKPAE